MLDHIMNPIPELEQDVLRAVEVLVERERRYENLKMMPVTDAVGDGKIRDSELGELRHSILAARGTLRKTWDALVKGHEKQITLDQQGYLDAEARR